MHGGNCFVGGVSTATERPALSLSACTSFFKRSVDVSIFSTTGQACLSVCRGKEEETKDEETRSRSIVKEIVRRRRRLPPFPSSWLVDLYHRHNERRIFLSSFTTSFSSLSFHVCSFSLSFVPEAFLWTESGPPRNAQLLPHSPPMARYLRAKASCLFFLLHACARPSSSRRSLSCQCLPLAETQVSCIWWRARRRRSKKPVER